MLKAELIVALDPSSRFPKPKPPPLSLLAQSVGKEKLIENKGRKAKIKKTRYVRVRRMDAFEAMDAGFF